MLMLHQTCIARSCNRVNEIGRDAKITELDATSFVCQDVGRLHISVDYS